jgi:hypothetical protein
VRSGFKTNLNRHGAAIQLKCELLVGSIVVVRNNRGAQAFARVVAHVAGMKGVRTYGIEFLEENDRMKNFWGSPFLRVLSCRAALVAMPTLTWHDRPLARLSQKTGHRICQRPLFVQTFRRLSSFFGNSVMVTCVAKRRSSRLALKTPVGVSGEDRKKCAFTLGAYESLPMLLKRSPR